MVWQTWRRRSVIDWPARILLAVAIIGANLAGAVLTALLALFLIPTGPFVDVNRLRVLNTALLPPFLLVAIPLATVWVAVGLLTNPRGDREVERRLVLYGPLRITLVQGVFWLVAVVFFGGLNWAYSARLGEAVTETVLVSGVATCALSYLIAERILRRAATRVLDGDPHRRRRTGGVLTRLLLFWILGTAVPITGLLATALGAIVHRDVPAQQLAVLVAVTGTLALLTGLLTTVGSARAVADPVRSVQRAMRQIETGDLDASVPVYDGTELGRMQAGFNTMAAGLRERDRIRELFSRQVGRDVASVTAAAREVRLGGQTRSLAVLFVDLVDSTVLVASRPPGEVMEVFNQFFQVVVDVVESCDGWINKFEGDAALAVFGAPNDVPDPAGSALRAARILSTRLAADVPDMVAGVGVSAGDAVAGYLGGARRYEYTVIGDPVNEAARLTELAKNAPGRVLAADCAVDLADPGEARRWVLGEPVRLRGRDRPTRPASPRAGPDSGTHTSDATGDGVTGDGVTGDGVTTEDVTVENVTGENATSDDVTSAS